MFISSTLRYVAGFVCASLALAGCSNEPAPEQKRADATLADAKALLVRGDYRTGKEKLFTALTIDEGLDRKVRMAEETRMLGEIAAQCASYDSALLWYARSLEDYKTLADQSGARDITLRVAGLQRQIGDERKAFQMYVEGLRLARVFHDEAGVRTIQWALLPCARALDEREEEERILRELLQDYTADGDVARQSAVMLESGNSRFAFRSFDRAAEDYLQSLMLADQARDSLLAVRATLRLAMTFEVGGRLRDALSNYAECLKRADRATGAAGLRLESLIRVGNLYLRNRQFSEAGRFFKAAISSAHAAGNRLAEGYLLLQLGDCDVESSREQAFRSFRSGMDTLRTIGTPAGLAYASLCLGNLFLRNNQPNDALQYFKGSIEQSEAVSASRTPDDLYLSCEQAYFGARKTPWYDEAIDLLLQLGRYDEAFWYVNRRKSRELHEELAGLDAQAADDGLRGLLAAYRNLRSRRIGAERQCLELAIAGMKGNDLLADARAGGEQAFTELHNAAAAVVKSDKAYEPFVQITGLSLAEVQKALPFGTALIEHVLARRSLYAFVVTGTRTGIYVSAFEKDRVFDLSREFVDLLRMRVAYADSSKPQQTPIDVRLRELSGTLHEAFVHPIEGAISGVSDLYVVLPREIPALPLHILSSRAFRGSGYLAEQHSLSYLPFAGSLLLPRSQPGQVRDIVGLGFPGGTSWDVEYELRDIRAFYKEARLYFDQQATLATLQREKGDVLHLALRFQFNDDQPGNSYVVLSDGKSVEGSKRVPTGEFLSLPAWPMIVISDLDEHRLGVRPAEAYLFLANRTQKLIFTSTVPLRKAKKYFGELFYTTLLSGASPGDAYRKAQLGMIRTAEYAPPYVWAPFFLWGK